MKKKLLLYIVGSGKFHQVGSALDCLPKNHYSKYYFLPSSVQVKFKSSSSSVQLRTETGLIITVRPTHPTPDKYNASTQEAEIWYAS